MKKILASLFCFWMSASLYAQIDTAFYRAQNDSLRQASDAEFADPNHSPLTEDDLDVFHGLPYFPFNPKFVVEARFEATPDEKPFLMPTSTSRLPQYVKHGHLYFAIDENEYRLSVYRNIDLSKKAGYENYLFIPFNDSTNGFESYGGGRYMDIQGPLGDTVIFDFNRAYNPYCAYNSRYSCPIPPQENNLPVRIEAGVLSWGEH